MLKRRNVLLTLLIVLQDQSLGNWQVKRQVGGDSPILYKFPHRFMLKAGTSVTVSLSLASRRFFTAGSR